MKVIITCGGRGTRLYPKTKEIPKILLDYEDEKVLDKIIGCLSSIVELEELIFVVNPLFGNEIVEYVRQKNLLVRSSFVIQERPEGFGHAVWLCKHFFDRGDSVMITTDDGIFRFHRDYAFDSFFQKSLLFSVSSDNPEQYGVIYVEGDRAVRLVEKPLNPDTNCVIAIPYYISDSCFLFEVLDEIIQKDIRERGEFQLTTALELMIRMGHEFFVEPVDWKDLGGGVGAKS